MESRRSKAPHRGTGGTAQSREPAEAACGGARLFIERGYDATRPQDIARAADVGYGTFYLHFTDKQDCFLAFAEAARPNSPLCRRPAAGVEGVEPQLRALLEALSTMPDRIRACSRRR